MALSPDSVAGNKAQDSGNEQPTPFTLMITDSRHQPHVPYSLCLLILVIQYCTSCCSPAFELSTALVHNSRLASTGTHNNHDANVSV